MVGNKIGHDYTDLVLKDWRDNDDILTDSLWNFERRETYGSSGHLSGNEFHGNYVPQIAYQLISRFTKAGEWVFDPFLGSGTSLIEAMRLGRHGCGSDISQESIDRFNLIIAEESNPHNMIMDVQCEDARSTCAYPANKMHLAILHPPYHNIVKFSESNLDMCNVSYPSFLSGMTNVFKGCNTVLESQRFMALIIGDKYENGELTPIGFDLMNLALQEGFKLKSIVVKNFGETKAKGKNTNLWRYRALAGGFYVFRHEYIYIFQKRD